MAGPNAAMTREKSKPVEAAAQEPIPGLCPIAETLHLMHEKWTLHIVYVLLTGTRRFNELRHEMGGVNARTLRDRLRGLEEAGIVTRREICAMPPHVEYTLTEKGKALSGVMEAMARWSRRWHDSGAENRSNSNGAAP